MDGDWLGPLFTYCHQSRSRSSSADHSSCAPAAKLERVAPAAGPPGIPCATRARGRADGTVHPMLLRYLQWFLRQIISARELPPVPKLGEPVLHHVNHPLLLSHPFRQDDPLAIRRDVIIRIRPVPETWMRKQTAWRTGGESPGRANRHGDQRIAFGIEQLPPFPAPPDLRRSIGRHRPLAPARQKLAHIQFIPARLIRYICHIPAIG